MATHAGGTVTATDTVRASDPQAAPALPAAPGDRDTVIDVIRGLCMVSMITAHTASHSIIATLLHLPRFITGLDGFVFLSGYVLGLIDTRRVARYGEAGAARRMVARAGILYLVQAFYTGVTLLWFLHSGWWPQLHDVSERGGWGIYLLNLAVFREGLFRNRLLSLYVLFLLLAPLALALMRRGKSMLVLAISAAIYATYWLTGGAWWPLDPGGFKLPGWQLFFFGGTVLGYNSAMLRCDVWPRVRRPMLAGSAVVASAFLIISLGLVSVQGLGSNPGDLFDTLGLGPGRVPYFLSALVMLYWTFGRLQRAGRFTWLLGVLQTIGSRSLYCFTVHMAFTLAAVALQFRHWMNPLQTEVWAWGVLVIVYLMARYRVLAKVIPN